MRGFGAQISMFLTAALVALLPLTSKADAELLWKNAKGFVSAQACQIVQQPDVDLRRVKPTGAIVNLQKTKAPVDSLVALNEDVFEIKGTSLPLKIGKTDVVTKGSFWQVSLTEDGQYLVYQCEEQGRQISYTVFDIFEAHSMVPLVRVGVQADETAIFQATQVYKPEEAEQKLNERALLFSSNNSSVTSSKPTVAPKILPKAQVAPTSTESQGSFDQITCFRGAGGEIFDESLTKVLFTSKANEKIIPVQSWSKNRLEKTVDGKTIGFVRVVFPDRDSSANAGFIAESAFQSRSACTVAKDDEDDDKDLRSRRRGSRGRGKQGRGGHRNSKRYAAAKRLGGAPLSAKVSVGTGAFEFPMLDRPQSSYLEGNRRFHAGRRGRLHAACDLYRPHGEAVVAIADGTVIRDRSYFYQDVFAIEIRHTNGSIARYGEVLGRAGPGIRLGAKVRKGQTVGYVGTVSSGCCHPMLHFELYSGKAKGSLTTRGKKYRRGKKSGGGNGFQRRADLMNPTALLQAWEKSDFGRSY